MRINKISFKNKGEEWGLSELSFFNLTLLVGVSGAGKTQILRSILDMKKIASGSAISGAIWNIHFTEGQFDYIWEGEFEISENSLAFPMDIFLGGDDDDESTPKFKFETIYLNKVIIANRIENEIYFEGSKMPKLSPEESLLSLFKEEEKIKPAFEGFQKIVFRDHTKKDNGISLRRMADYSSIEKYQTIEDIRKSNLETIDKLFFLQKNQRDYFNKIVESYKDVFPQIEAVKVESLERDKRRPSWLSEIPLLQFKEIGSNKWIFQDKMSSGMIRTFLHISEMQLLREGTVVLIDEFENSLGVNCIDVLTDDLIFENNRLQFIATSHHPYIINKIPYEHWKIVSRDKGEIISHDAKDYNLGDSNHDAFMNLVNLPEFRLGNASPL